MLLLSALLLLPVFAVCVHTWNTYCDASHPHEQYKYCSKCGAVQYLGTYVTKRHGDGSWGSGTCPDCGSCSYSGRSCTSQGVCVCGNTISAYGHSYAAATCVAARTCSRCGATSGSALGHNDTLYCDAAHIDGQGHARFYLCSRCGRTSYTGSYIAKPHGPGTVGSNSCKQCGSHSYTLEVTISSVHPHPQSGKCICGDTGSPGNATQPYAGCIVCENIAPTGISLSHSELAIKEGIAAPITAIITPSNASNQMICWSSNNPTVASVSAVGAITAHSVGTATITGTTVNGLTSSCIVTVFEYQAIVNHYIDNAYPLFYETSNTDARATIMFYRTQVNDAFWNKFRLYISENSNPTYFVASTIQSCKTNAQPAGDTTPYTERNCHDLPDSSLASVSGNYHTELGNRYCTSREGLAYDVYHNLLDDTANGVMTSVIWSGHKVFSFSEFGQLEFDRSASYPTWKVVTMLERVTTDVDLKQKGVLMHELCHQFCDKKLDHYCTSQYPGPIGYSTCAYNTRCYYHALNPADKRPLGCVMEEPRQSLDRNDLLCSKCQEDILEHLAAYH